MKAKHDYGLKCVCAVFAIAAGSLFCRGQPNSGPSVQLDNYTINRPIYYQAVGNLAAGPDFYVEILGGPDVNHLQPIARAPTDTVKFSIGTGPDGPGFFDGGIGIVPGLEPTRSGVGTFQVLAWKGAPTFDAALQRVASATWTQLTGYTSPPPDLPIGGVLDFPANLVIPAVPEPSSWVLYSVAMIGLFAVLKAFGANVRRLRFLN